jgi:hypothetical protein
MGTVFDMCWSRVAVDLRTTRYTSLLVGGGGGWGDLGRYLKETACGVAYPHGQDALPQEGIDGGGLAIAGTPKERHLHVVSFQHLSNTRHPSAYAHKPMVILTRA